MRKDKDRSSGSYFVCFRGVICKRLEMFFTGGYGETISKLPRRKGDPRGLNSNLSLNLTFLGGGLWGRENEFNNLVNLTSKTEPTVS